MDAKRIMAKESQPREADSQARKGETRQLEGIALETVIERAQGHNADALGEIYCRYVQRVFGLCRYLLNSRESAEDATGEVFLKLQRSLESYDGSIPFPRWLLRVTGNQCIDVLRRRQRGLKVFVEVEDGAAALEAPASQPSPLNAVISSQERAQVRDIIARLPENYRVPLVLRYYGELSYDEIAHQLGLERNHVAALIFRAKQEMRRRLAPRSK